MTHPDDLTYVVDDVPPLPKLIFLGLRQAMVISIVLRSLDFRAFWRRCIRTKCAPGSTTNAVTSSWFLHSRLAQRCVQ